MKGLTIIELVISIAIILTLTVLITDVFREFRDMQILNGSAEEAASLINEAHSKTLASEKSLQYGIHIETGRIVLFEGVVFSEPNPTNRELKISSQVEISSISLNGGGSEIIFQKLTGETSQYGTITIRLKRNLSKTKIVKINQTGIITIQ